MSLLQFTADFILKSGVGRKCVKIKKSSADDAGRVAKLLAIISVSSSGLQTRIELDGRTEIGQPDFQHSTGCWLLRNRAVFGLSR